MQLLKVRNFSEFISDSFEFVKENWKHFFATYFVVNGLYLLLNGINSYLTMSSMSNLMTPENGDFTNIGGLYGTGGSSLSFVLGVGIFLLSILNFTFVPLYMSLYSKRKTNFDYKDVLNLFKENIWKIIKFGLAILVIIIPFAIVFYILFLLLLITIVGGPMVVGAAMLFFVLAFYEYINTNKGVFESFGYAIKMIKSKLMATTGSTALLMMIVYIFVLTLLGTTGLFSSFSDLVAGNQAQFFDQYFKAFTSPQMIIGMLLSGVLMSVIQIGQGVIYFSQKEFLENISATDDIDSIGSLELED